MLTLSEIKHRLPEEFLQNLYQMFTPINVDKIILGISEKKYTTLRVNTIKYNIQDIMKYFKEINIKFDRIPWYKDALLIKNVNEKDIQKLDIYQNGYIYLQSLSSMIPALVLNPKENEKVLDLTAAPGGKTTQIAALMQNKGTIIANELDKIRYERLKYNVDKQGAKIVQAVNERGEKLGEKYEEYFDKVLLDAPCSGEGSLSVHELQKYKGIYNKKISEISKLQKKLFASAYKALKSNGTMVYSTCTLNKEENEYIINWALQNFNIKILDIDIEIKDSIPAFNDNVDKSISKAIRTLPSKNMEGFFVAKIRKI